MSADVAKSIVLFIEPSRKSPVCYHNFVAPWSNSFNSAAAGAPRRGDGAIYLNDPAVDVSPGNDWSELRVWNARTHDWGIRNYPVEGFIGPEPLGGSDRVAAR